MDMDWLQQLMGGSGMGGVFGGDPMAGAVNSMAPSFQAQAGYNNGMGGMSQTAPFNPDDRMATDPKWQNYNDNDRMKRMLAGLGSMQRSPMAPMAPAGRAPGINPGQVGQFAGMSPYRGLLQSVRKPAAQGLM